MTVSVSGSGSHNDDTLREAPTPIKGRCGTCDWPTNRLPCPYCEAVRARAVAAALRSSAAAPEREAAR